MKEPVGMLTRRSFLTTLGAGGVIVAAARAAPQDPRSPPSPSVDPLESSFQAPAHTFMAWAYWWWLDSAVTKAGITADLEAMKLQGIAGVLLFDAGIGGPGAPKGPRFMSPEWRQNFVHAVTEAARLQIEL